MIKNQLGKTVNPTQSVKNPTQSVIYKNKNKYEIC